ncbi:MAG TPA: DAK2 domain-containing protein [Actinomycetes bacterium]|nr:DAK2 domain-containing protein [Actinomycetes bacterium]
MSSLASLDAKALARWATYARDALGEARAEIDELNVYPVPDGDTGTNLHLTFVAAVDALAAPDDADRPGDAERPRDPDRPDGVPGPAAVLGALAQGALMGARGNSGVILSQLLRGLADGVGQASEVGPAELAAALAVGARAAYDAVARPVEGTMLTVARVAAEEAERAAAAAEPAADLGRIVTAAADGAREALRRTPEQLDVLARAGVVDAGGRGVCVVLDALATAVTGAVPAVVDTTVPAHEVEAARPRSGLDVEDPDAHGPTYEVMYLLDAPADAIRALRAALEPLGDSLLVVGAEPTWNVHVHVDDVGAAVEAGVEAGRPHRIRVTHFRDAARASVAGLHPASRGVVSVVAGDGLAALFEAAGATVVVGGPGRRASTAELLTGLRQAKARDLVVLPNDADSLAVAEAAAAKARDEGLRVAVIPTRASVQAIAALAVHDESRRFEDDVVAMTAAAGHCRHGGVTVAARAAVTTGGVCKPGDVLGIVDGDFAVIGDDLVEVAGTVVGRMLGSGGELVTLVRGADADADLADAVARRVRSARPEVDTVVYEGGQSRYPLLIGVE